jgi:hypothetical protein
MKKKVCILDKYHHKNQVFLEYLVDTHFNRVKTIAEADVVLSASTSIDIQNYPQKKFIFGPHFSVFPENKIIKINNIHNNALYIQPSEPSRFTWMNEYNFKTMPVVSMAFGVDTNKFMPVDSLVRDLVILYHKNRDPKDLAHVVSFLKSRNIEYKLFDYRTRYTEASYIDSLRRAKYVVWVGSHESQGFALEEALSCNVPLLVWSVTIRTQEWNNRHTYRNVKSPVSSVPYWDSMCGEVFYKEDELETTFDKFISKLNSYTPRQFVLDTLCNSVRANEWAKLINNFI